MPALTLWQPYASLVMAGIKPWETRSWCAPRRLWGSRIAVHAAKRPVRMDDWSHLPAEVLRSTAFVQLLDAWIYGAVLGTVEVLYCMRVVGHGHDHHGNLIRFCEQPDPDGDLRPDPPLTSFDDDGLGDYSPGRWVWRLRNPQYLADPIYTRGFQRLWTWTPPEVELSNE